MKIAILGATNLKHMTLLSHYLKNINFDINVVDVIYMDRYGTKESIDNVQEYYRYRIRYKNNFLKILSYLEFKRYAKTIIKKNKYDIVIVWGSYTAHLFKRLLTDEYNGKYILNIRDYFFENNKYIKNRFKKIIKNSIFTVLSSDGFLEFLPKSNKYKVVYSYNENIINKAQQATNFNNTPIKISFIGNNRFFDINKKLMLALKNDQRFILQYFGTNSNVLKEFAITNHIENTSFIEGFNTEDTSILLDKTDIINNVYGSNNIALTTALSIRLYYAIFLKKPILTSPNTYTSQVANSLKIGFDVDLDDKNLANNIYDWYRNLDINDVKKETSQYNNKIKNNNEKFYHELRKVLNE